MGSNSGKNSSKRYLDEGNAKYQAGQYKEAIEAYTQAIDADPVCADAYLWRGLAYDQLKEHKKAIEDFSKALNINDQDPYIYGFRGGAKVLLAQAKQNDPEYLKDAVEDFNVAISLGWNRYFVRGVAELELGRQQKNKDLAAISSDYFTNAIKDFSEAVKLDKNALTYNFLGIAKLESWPVAKFQDILPDFDEAIRLKPKFAMAYRNRGVIKAALNDFQGAIDDFSESIKLDPESADTHYLRGKIRVNNEIFLKQPNCYEEVIHDFDTAIRLGLKTADVYHIRGYANFLFGIYQKAIEDTNEATKLDQKHIYAYIARGAAKLHLSHFEEAMDDFNRATSLNSKEKKDLNVLYSNFGLTKMLQGNYKGAIQDFEQAINTKCSSLTSYFRKIILLLKDNELAKLAEAKKIQQLAAELDANSVYTQLSQLLINFVECEDKSIQEKSEILIAPKHASEKISIFLCMGYFFQWFNQYDLARNYFNKALETRPNFVLAQNAMFNLCNTLPPQSQAISALADALRDDDYLKQLLVEAEKKIKQAAKENEQLKTMLNQSQDDLDHSAEFFNKKIDDLNHTLAKLKIENENLCAENKKINTENQDLKEETEQLQGQIKRLTQEIGNLHEEIAELKNSLDKKDKDWDSKLKNSLTENNKNWDLKLKTSIEENNKAWNSQFAQLKKEINELQKDKKGNSGSFWKKSSSEPEKPPEPKAGEHPTLN